MPTAGFTRPNSKLSSWEIENTDSANSIFINEQAAVSAADETGGSEVPAGSTRAFFFDPDQNPLIGLRAATAAVLVNIRREYFRSRLGWNIARYASVRVQQAEQFFRRLSATAIEPRGAFTTIRAGASKALILENDQANAAVTIDAGANGGVAVQSDGTGFAELRSSDAADFFRATTGGTMGVFRNGARSLTFSDSETGVSNLVVRPLLLRAGETTDERHRFNSTDRYMRMVGDGASSTVFDTIELPIVDGNVIAAGDGVIYAFAGNRVNKITLAGALQLVGICVVGGTGDAAGTVKALIRVFGVLVGTLIADNAGVTAGQYLIGGAADVNQYASQASPQQSAGRVLATAASGVAFDVRLGMG